MTEQIDNLAARAVALRDQHPDWGYRTIAAEIGSDRHHVRRWLTNAERAAGKALQAAPHSTASSLSHYDSARHALAIAKSLDEVVEIADKATAIKEYARRAKDRQLQIDATEIVIRSERRLGEMLAEIKATTGLASGGQPYQEKFTGPELEPVARPPTLEEIGVDKKLSSRAQKLAAVPESAMEARIADWRQSASEDGGRVGLNILKDVSTQGKQEARAAREAALGAKQASLPARKYGVILADPEWRFEPYSRETGMDRAADNHYPTSETDVIAARDVTSIAADDCVLFLWATAPMLPQALDVMKSWGFAYKSHCVWVKDRIGTGYWFRNKHELLLVATKGDVPAPAMGTQWTSAQGPIAVGAHSEKPDDFLRMIEGYFPNLPKIELNRRGMARPGWDAWGNEAETEPDATPAGAVVAETSGVTAGETAPPPVSQHDGDVGEIPTFLKRAGG